MQSGAPFACIAQIKAKGRGIDDHSFGGSVASFRSIACHSFDIA